MTYRTRSSLETFLSVLHLKSKPYWSPHSWYQSRIFYGAGKLRYRSTLSTWTAAEFTSNAEHRPVAFLSQYWDTVRVDCSCYSPHSYYSPAVQDRNIAVPVRGVQVPKHSGRSHAAITLIDPRCAIAKSMSYDIARRHLQATTHRNIT